MLRRILIANRGEIACRIIRACHGLEAEAVAVFSEADASALHVRMADNAVLIGPAAPGQSYLDQTVLLRAAQETDCDAVHPGYGFLAENPDFARLVLDAGLAWVGPPPQAMRGMGLKVEARHTAAEAGAPLVPGFDGVGVTDEDFLVAAGGIGVPLLVKASAGGGGRGIRLVRDLAELPEALAAARREAESAFGNGDVYLEKYIERPRHIEVQVLADKLGRAVHLGERECSIQRRHQKIIEETPSTAVSAELRARLGSDAVEIARRVAYVGAGTVEFMLDAAGNHYFMEMNTRLQVEHPITELTYGVDIVQWQLRIAAGEMLPAEWMVEGALTPRGHSIECRICAEDAGAGFLPQAGVVGLLRESTGPGVRVDSGIYQGLTIGSHYDSLLSKLIVHAETRPAAIARMTQALRDYVILGVTTNRDFLIDVTGSAAFKAGDTHTGFIEEHFSGWAQPAPSAAVSAAATVLLARRVPAPSEELKESSVWQTAGSWSNV